MSHSAVLGMIGHAAANSQELFSPFFLRCKTMWFMPESPRYVMHMKGYDAGIEVSAAIWFTPESLRYVMNVKGLRCRH